MNPLIKSAAKQIGWQWLNRKLKPKSHEDVARATCLAINHWAVNDLKVASDNLPFPFLDTAAQSQDLGDDWDLTKWNHKKPIWQIQDEFTLCQKSSEGEWRWINGRTEPMEKHR